MKNIGVIDSGVGGLTVLFDVIKTFPNCNYFYVGDSKNCPYGTKSIDEIKKLSFNIVKYLIDNKKIDILIIACNSISSTASEYLRACFKNLIIIETVEPTTNYVKQLDCKKIGLIATNATVNSKMYESKLSDYEIISKACPIFVDIVENPNISIEEKDIIVKQELNELIYQNIDTLILGCTHFPLLTSSIEKVFDGKIINSSNAIILELEKHIKNTNEIGKVEINTTGDTNIFKEQLKVIFNKEYTINKIEVNSDIDYSVSLDQFEGPLDLLLHLIKESNIDIYEIKIEEVASQYLDYIKKAETLNLEIASEYLVMAAELIEIKSKLLLPKKELEVEDEEIDDRENLITRLIEYQKYKEITSAFKVLESDRNDIHTKLPSKVELDVSIISDENNMDINLLVEAFQKLLERKKAEQPLNTTVTKKELSVQEKCVKIRNMLKHKSKITFEELFETVNIPNVVVTFLSILEMIKKNEITIIQENNFSNITISLRGE